MSRQARRLSNTGMYHIIFRGINRQDIFINYNDYQKMKSILLKVKGETATEIYAYCLMKNHVHLFLKEEEPGDVSKVMSKILSSYAGWFNRKYERTGHLFESRYKSEPVEDEAYYFALIRYIHLNPVKAGIVKKPDEYPYSSYAEYIFEPILTDTNMLFEITGNDKEYSLQEFVDLHNVEETLDFDIKGKYKNSDRNIKQILKDEYKLTDIEKITREMRNEIIKQLTDKHKISNTSLAKTFGISKSTVTKIVNK